jgi:hypothetical protein
MYFFYEVGIISAKIFGRKKAQETSEPSSTVSQPSRMRPAAQTAGATGGGDDEYVSVSDSEPR